MQNGINPVKDDRNASAIIGLFVGDIHVEDTRGGDGNQPFVKEGGKQGGVRSGSDVDAIARRKTGLDGFIAGGQVYDKVGRREEVAGMDVVATKKVELRVGEPATRVEETRETVEVKVKTTVHQGGTRVSAQEPFLFGAIEEEVKLIGECEARVAFEGRLERALSVAFKTEGELIPGVEGAHKTGLSHAADTDDGKYV